MAAAHCFRPCLKAALICVLLLAVAGSLGQVAAAPVSGAVLFIPALNQAALKPYLPRGEVLEAGPEGRYKIKLQVQDF
jgi:hypothetical protein